MGSRCALLALILLGTLASAGLARGGKKLIEFGWDEPDTDFMRQHIAQMRATPFDGCVFHARVRRPGGTRGNFAWECWGATAFADDALQEALDDLRRTPFGRFRENFLRFNVCPGTVDWFDDFSPVLQNARLAARLVARAPGVAGILFDIEQYNGPLFHYPSRKHAESRTWEEYAAQVRLRGRELMEAFQSECPGITIFLTFGYCLPWYQMGGERSLAEVEYGLLAPLLDGMLAAAEPGVRFVDGHEASYPYREHGQFASAYELMRSGVLPIVADHVKYRERYSFGFGVWMDMDWRNRGWDEHDFGLNYFTPEALEQSLRAALEVADEYVWVYTETPRWWTEHGRPAKLPAAYWEAVARARMARGGH